jgi:hypothetical protein
VANNSRIQPLFVDTASSSRLVSDTTEIMISGILPIPSAATWAVILKNGAGDIIYSANNTGGIPPNPIVPFKTTGLVIDTLTSATCLIYTIPG